MDKATGTKMQESQESNELRRKMEESLQKLRKPNELTDEVRNLPPNLIAAFLTGRPELVTITDTVMQPLLIEETRAVYHAFRVLLETNLALQEHAELCAQLAIEIAGTVKGMQTRLKTGIQDSANELANFASFQERTEDEED